MPFAVVFDRVGKKVDENLLHPGLIGMDKPIDIEVGKGDTNATLLCLRFHYGLAIAHHLGQRIGSGDSDTFPDSICARSRISLISFSRCHPARRSDRCLPSGGRWRRRIGIEELGEAEDRIERRAKLMAHAGKELRFRQRVGLLRRGLGALQLDVLLLDLLVEEFAVGAHAYPVPPWLASLNVIVPPRATSMVFPSSSTWTTVSAAGEASSVGVADPSVAAGDVLPAWQPLQAIRAIPQIARAPGADRSKAALPSSIASRGVGRAPFVRFL